MGYRPGEARVLYDMQLPKGTWTPSDDGRWMTAVNDDGLVIVDTADGHIKHLVKPPGDDVRTYGWSRYGLLVQTTTGWHIVRDGKVVGAFAAEGDVAHWMSIDALRATAWSPAADRIALVTTRGLVRVVDLNGVELSRFETGLERAGLFWVGDDLALVTEAGVRFWSVEGSIHPHPEDDDGHGQQGP